MNLFDTFTRPMRKEVAYQAGLRDSKWLPLECLLCSERLAGACANAPINVRMLCDYVVDRMYSRDKYLWLRRNPFPAAVGLRYMPSVDRQECGGIGGGAIQQALTRRASTRCVLGCMFPSQT